MEYMHCNTGRCRGKIKVTDELRPKIDSGGVPLLKAVHAGKCPKCGSYAGFVSKEASDFAHEISQMFVFK